MAYLARICIHPVKSLDPQPVHQALLLASGALQHDRRYALVDRRGQFINGKRTPAVHRLRSRFDPQSETLSLRVEGESRIQTFHTADQRQELLDWLSRFFEIEVDLIENRTAGLPDDVESPGPTVVSTATLRAIGEWFGGLALDDVRTRFRANLEIDGVEPFWEDRLLGESFQAVRFKIGDAELLGANPCQRCVVPTRDPVSGEPLQAFARTFAAKRQEQLPGWAPAGRFDHFYRLAVNTRPVNAAPALLRTGDEVRILGLG